MKMKVWLISSGLTALVMWAVGFPWYAALSGFLTSGLIGSWFNRS